MRLPRYLFARLEGEPALLQVRGPGRCDHLSRICWNCLDTWSLDYDIWLGRTPTGRRMAAHLGLSTALTPGQLRDVFARDRATTSPDNTPLPTPPVASAS